MSTPLVTCDNLVKIYKVPEANVEVVALQGLDLEVPQGELLVIVGQSGSGKTTLLNILGALDLPSAGRCVVGEYDLTRLKERQHNDYRRFIVGHMWQQSGRNLLPDLTILDNVSLPQVLAGVSGARRLRRSRELLKLVGLGGMAQKYPEQLSGGEQQRAAIAVALANEPSLLLADEPTGELDSQTAHEVLALLRRLNQELALTIILVTHDPAIAAAADRTIAIRDGRTSTETVRREQPLPVSASRMPDSADTVTAASVTNADMGSVVIGLPQRTHRESVLIDRVGRLQLPEDAITRIAFNGRADLRIGADHVELWPVGTGGSNGTAMAAVSAIIGLPADAYHESVVIDGVGRLQLSEDALDRVPFGRHAAVRILAEHVELWPRGVAD